MREYLRIFAKTGVVLFCAWHMFVVAAYSVPEWGNEHTTEWVQRNVISRVAPYLLITSQWQQWNLFAPDPLRRIVFFRIESENANGDWAYVASVNDTTYSMFRHATRFKLLGQAFPENDPGLQPVSDRGAQVFCREFGLDPGQGIRVWHEVAVIPYIRPSPSKIWWDQWVPQYEPALAIQTVCES